MNFLSLIHSFFIHIWQLCVMSSLLIASHLITSHLFSFLLFFFIIACVDAELSPGLRTAHNPMLSCALAITIAMADSVAACVLSSIEVPYYQGQGNSRGWVNPLTAYLAVLDRWDLFYRLSLCVFVLYSNLFNLYCVVSSSFMLHEYEIYTMSDCCYYLIFHMRILT